jgi:ABC-2 type transport system ATP-binding protein
VINGGELLLVEEKAALMQRLGQKTLQVDLQARVDTVPESLASYDLEVAEDGHALRYHYDTSGESTGITRLLGDISAAGLQLKDLQTDQSSLEDIFVGLVKEGAA